jgi:NADH dehydrogenase
VILLTGGTGFGGSKVAHALRAKSYDVRCLARKPARADHLRAWGCEVVQGDATNAASLRAAVNGCDTVVHLIGIRQGRPAEFQRVMVDGTRDLLAAAHEAGVRRFVLMSALGVTEQTKDLVPYYHAKWAMEQDVKGSGIEYVIFRPSFLFGRDGGILQTFKKLARLMPVTPIIGAGTQRIQPIWVEDMAAYVAAAVDKAEAANSTFEIGGPDVVTWNEFWERLKRTLRVRRASVHLPIGLMRLNALVTERMPGDIPLTRDLLKMLEGPDNVVSNDDAVRTFGLPLVTLDEQLRRAA